LTYRLFFCSFFCLPFLSSPLHRIAFVRTCWVEGRRERAASVKRFKKTNVPLMICCSNENV
jgi:hypothetical protein